MFRKEDLENMKSLWKLSLRTLSKHPRICFPLFVTALFKFFFLVVFYYSPRPPLVGILGPPIRKFFGEIYLHYPGNFILLPSFFYYGEIFVWLTVSICMLAVVVSMVTQVHEGRSFPVIMGSFNHSLRRYPALFLTALIIFILSTLAFRIPRFIVINFYPFAIGKFLVLQLFFLLSFIAAVIIEVGFIYAVASIIIEKQRFIGALKRSLKVSRDMFAPSFILIFVPRFFDLIIAFLKQKLPLIMLKTCPDITTYILGLSVAVAFCTDLIVIVSVTNLFLIKKNAEENDSNQRISLSR